MLLYDFLLNNDRVAVRPQNNDDFVTCTTIINFNETMNSDYVGSCITLDFTRH